MDNNFNQYELTQQPMGMPSARILNTNRELLKYILLSWITFGIYSIIVFSGISDDINTIASRYDGKKTMHYCLLLFLVGPITLGIAYLVWFHKICGRIGDELSRRGIGYSFGTGTFWGWGFLGSFIFVGPFIFVHKMFTAMNLLCQSYNRTGM